jgi:hypothetical protein
MANFEDLGKFLTDTEKTIAQTNSDKAGLEEALKNSKESLEKFWKDQADAVGGYTYTDYDDAKSYISNFLDNKDKENELNDIQNNTTTSSKDKTPKTYEEKAKFLALVEKETKKYEATRKLLLDKAYVINKMQVSMLEKNDLLIEEATQELAKMEKQYEKLQKEIEKEEEKISELELDLESIYSKGPLTEEDYETVQDINIKLENSKVIKNSLINEQDKLDIASKKMELRDFKAENDELRENMKAFFEDFSKEFSEVDFESYVPQEKKAPRETSQDRSNNDGQTQDNAYKPKTNNDEQTAPKKDFEAKPKQSQTSVPSNNNIAPFAAVPESNDVIQEEKSNLPVVSLKGMPLIEEYLKMNSSERRKALETSGYRDIIEAIGSDDVKLNSKQRRAFKKILKEDENETLNSVDLSKENVIKQLRSIGIDIDDDIYADIYGGKKSNIVSNLSGISAMNLENLKVTMDCFYREMDEGSFDKDDIEIFNKYLGNLVKQGELQSRAKNITSPVKYGISNIFRKQKFTNINALNDSIVNGEQAIDDKIAKKNSKFLNSIAQMVQKDPKVEYLTERTKVISRDTKTNEQAR